MPVQTLTPNLINAAIEGFESQKRRIDEQIAELRAMLSGGRAEPTTAAESSPRQRRTLSAAARMRIADAQRKRWAASRKESEPAADVEAAKPNRKLSAAGRRNIVAATKKRWAAVRAAKAQQEAAAASKTSAKKAAKRAPVKAVKKKAAKRAQKPAAAAKQTAPEPAAQ